MDAGIDVPDLNRSFRLDERPVRAESNDLEKSPPKRIGVADEEVARSAVNQKEAGSPLRGRCTMLIFMFPASQWEDCDIKECMGLTLSNCEGQ
jgi:hypothetical protein